MGEKKSLLRIGEEGQKKRAKGKKKESGPAKGKKKEFPKTKGKKKRSKGKKNDRLGGRKRRPHEVVNVGKHTEETWKRRPPDHPGARFMHGRDRSELKKCRICHGRDGFAQWGGGGRDALLADRGKKCKISRRSGRKMLPLMSDILVY